MMAETASCDPKPCCSLLPGHMIKLHFPGSLALRCVHVTEFWPIHPNPCVPVLCFLPLDGNGQEAEGVGGVTWENEPVFLVLHLQWSHASARIPTRTLP